MGTLRAAAGNLGEGTDKRRLITLSHSSVIRLCSTACISLIFPIIPENLSASGTAFYLTSTHFWYFV